MTIPSRLRPRLIFEAPRDATANALRDVFVTISTSAARQRANKRSDWDD